MKPAPHFFHLTLGLLLLAASSSQLAAQPSQLAAQPSKLAAQQYWQQEVNYKINVSLNDIEHTLDGFVRIEYTNRSPDTLSFIWFHLWPNAYKNDQTAFSEQALGNGRTDFYFSDPSAKGYINRLDFRVDGVIANTEDHPQYIDIVKLVLPQAIPPGGRINITTPFHERLPYPFSRGGYAHGLYQVTQWYPKPAVYDRSGWHPMPYLDQGEYYSEYGNFEVTITLPKGYKVAATGILTASADSSPASADSSPTSADANPISVTSGRTPPASQTLRYRQDHIHDFAWFADKQYHSDHDTLILASGRIIDLYAYYLPASAPLWKNSMQYMKDAIRFRSSLIGEYPFGIVSIVEARMGGAIGGMEYPTIAAINPQTSAKDLELTIEHEIGHNWFYAVLGTNERRYPWMDEGINTYYDERYKAWKYPSNGTSSDDYTVMSTLHVDRYRLYINALAEQHLDQPISTSSEDFTSLNYELIAYGKTRLWMQQLEDTLGRSSFDSSMREYYRVWQFKHPYPDDFRAIIENTSHRKLDAPFALLDRTGPISPTPSHKAIHAAVFARSSDRYNYIGILPAIGYNTYDKFMIGALIHNYNLPPTPFQFLVAPLYATNSHQLNGTGRVSYSGFPDQHFQKIGIALSASKFSALSGVDSNGHKIFGGFYKIVPSARFTLRNRTARSTMEKWIEWKTFLIGQRGFDNYVLKSTDSFYYPTTGKYHFRYLNQLGLAIEDHRVLYPYSALLQFQQAPEWYRINFTGNYFFNYATGGGMALRFFAAKFGFLGGNSSDLSLTAYEPKLTAVRGDEDYTYGNYFVGRNEFSGFASQQIMIRDGGLKIRTDLFQGLQGRSDNWIAALNFNTTLPPNLLPQWLPLKIFFDVGTYAEAWQSNATTDKFLYTGGLQLSLLHNAVNFYAPIFYSGVFGDNLKTVPDENSFWKKLSFSIDLQNINLHKTFGPYDF